MTVIDPSVVEKSRCLNLQATEDHLLDAAEVGSDAIWAGLHQANELIAAAAALLLELQLDSAGLPADHVAGAAVAERQAGEVAGSGEAGWRLSPR